MHKVDPTDAYVIHFYNPSGRADPLPELIAGIQLTADVFKYRLSTKKSGCYKPVLGRPVPLNLEVISCEYKPENPEYPYFIRAQPRPQLPVFLSTAARQDALLSRLSTTDMFTIRYNAGQNIGVLVYYGYEFAALDTSPLMHLWRSAFNQQHANSGFFVPSASTQDATPKDS